MTDCRAAPVCLSRGIAQVSPGHHILHSPWTKQLPQLGALWGGGNAIQNREILHGKKE